MASGLWDSFTDAQKKTLAKGIVNGKIIYTASGRKHFMIGLGSVPTDTVYFWDQSRWGRFKRWVKTICQN